MIFLILFWSSTHIVKLDTKKLSTFSSYCIKLWTNQYVRSDILHSETLWAN